MTTPRATHFPVPGPGDAPEITPTLAWVLDTVRASHWSGTSEGGIDLFDTCDLLSLDRHTAAHTYATALALGLGQALGVPPDIAAPGAEQLTFDEAWLMRLLECSLGHDAESVAFLISSRVPHARRAPVAFLVEGLSQRMENVKSDT